MTDTVRRPAAVREYAIAPDPVLTSRRKRRAITARTNGGPWVVILMVADSDADAVLETLQCERAFHDGRAARPDHVATLVEKFAADRADHSRRGTRWPPLPQDYR